MARMKFYCDAERCIECNACITACKNENEVPWGVNRRRVVTIKDGDPGERSLSLPVCIVRMHPVRRCVPLIVSILRMMALYCMTKIYVLVVVIAFMPVLLGRHSSQVLKRFLHVERWISVHSAPVARKRRIVVKNTVSTVLIALLKASYHCVRRCAQPKLYWLVMRTYCLTFTVNALLIVEQVFSTGVCNIRKPV